MPPERYPPDDPREWMNRARSNLALAKNRAPGVYLEDLCFEAQQAAEKAVKAVLIGAGIDFPYTHDLTRLVSLLPEADVPPMVRDAGRLTRYAMVSRYPGTGGPVSEEDYLAAVTIAEHILEWAESRVAEGRGR